MQFRMAAPPSFKFSAYFKNLGCAADPAVLISCCLADLKMTIPYVRTKETCSL